MVSQLSAYLLSFAFVSSCLAVEADGQAGTIDATRKKSVKGEIHSVSITSAMLFPGTFFNIVVGGTSPSNGKRCDIHYEIWNESGQGLESGALGNRVRTFPFPSKTWKFDTEGSRTIKVWSASADCRGQAQLKVSVLASYFQKQRVQS